jgi:hypothetical protein
MSLRHSAGLCCSPHYDSSAGDTAEACEDGEWVRVWVAGMAGFDFGDKSGADGKENTRKERFCRSSKVFILHSLVAAFL